MADELDDTLFHVGRAQYDSEDPSWHSLCERIETFLRKTFRGRKFPAAQNDQDFVAIVLFKVFRDLPRAVLKEREEFWAWVRRLAINTINGMWRHAGRAKRGGGAAVVSLHGAEGELAFDCVDADTLAASVLMRQAEVRDVIAGCLAELPEETAAILRLRLFEGLEFGKIAERLERGSADSLRSSFKRGRAKLAHCLRARGFDVGELPGGE